MDWKDLEVGKAYVTTDDVEVCFYDDGICNMQNMIVLAPDTELTYVGRNATDDGYVFQNGDATKYCLHDDDLAYITEA